MLQQAIFSTQFSHIINRTDWWTISIRSKGVEHEVYIQILSTRWTMQHCLQDTTWLSATRGMYNHKVLFMRRKIGDVRHLMFRLSSQSVGADYALCIFLPTLSSFKRKPDDMVIAIIIIISISSTLLFSNIFLLWRSMFDDASNQCYKIESEKFIICFS